MLDGEVVVLDEKAQPRFGLLQKRALLQRRTDIERAAVELPATLFAFDLLAFEDFDLRPLPLSERKALLKRLLPRAGPVRFADHVEERGEELLAAGRRLGPRRRSSGRRRTRPTASGRSPDWVKVRSTEPATSPSSGYTKPEGGRAGFGALHLAYWREGEREGAGPDLRRPRRHRLQRQKQLSEIHERLRERERPEPGLCGSGSDGTRTRLGRAASSSARSGSRSGPAKASCAIRSSCACAMTSRSTECVREGEPNMSMAAEPLPPAAAARSR